MDEQSKKGNSKLKNIKKNQRELKNTITEIQNTPLGINSRWDDIEGWISDWKEGRIVELNQHEQKKEKRILKIWR